MDSFYKPRERIFFRAFNVSLVDESLWHSRMRSRVGVERPEAEPDPGGVLW